MNKLTDNVQPLDLISAVNDLVEEASNVPTNLSDLVDDTATTPINKATTAIKLGSSDVGGETQPLYLSSGEPTACTYTLAKSVPSDAVFTDTTYNAFTGADGTDAGSMGLVPAPLATDNNKFLKGDGTWTYVTGGSGADIDLSNLTSTGEAHFQAPLISGTNIKTINNTSILGRGNLNIGKNIGEIVSSTIPLTDAGLHLLDGSLLQYGSYQAFIDYIAGLATNYPNLFTIETSWQNTVTRYGVCGKFVYNSTNKTVRLPKITGFTEGTIDPTVLGNLVEAGLPNITGDYQSHGLGALDSYSGALTTTEYPNVNYAAHNSTSANIHNLAFDASLSNSIYGNSTTVQPQSIKVLYYIVIATSTKTDIQVDIDEIATDLNGKADTGLSNLTTTRSTNFDSQWTVSTSYKYVANGVTINSNAAYSSNISSALPSDTYKYEVVISGWGYTATTSGNTANIYVTTDLSSSFSDAWMLAKAKTQAGNAGHWGGSATVVVGTGRTIYIKNTGTGKVTDVTIWISAYRRVGTNS